MDIDFHYYATYAAACKAGFTPQEATVIATAAQYVDDSNIEHISASPLGVVRPGWRYYIEDFVPVPTVQSIEEFIRMEINPDEWGDSFLNNLRQVWTVFHFLPGNYKNTPGMQTYNGPKTWKSWSYGKEDEDSFKMLCLPNSSLVSNIINDIRLNHRNRDYYLCLIGLRMHVLADTWAHTYYTGSPAWCINDAGEEVYSIDRIGDLENKTKVNWLRVSYRDWNQKASSIIHGEVATPPSLFVNSVCYAGHGRMGHLPDYPWISYDYQPKWAGERTIRKNNTDDYIKAFKQMVYAMNCIHNDKPFDIATPYGPDGLVSKEDEKTIRDIMLMTLNKDGREDYTQRCTAWKNNLTTLKLAPIADYNNQSWVNEFKGSKSRASNYYRFNYAARLHFDFVAKTLKDDLGVFIDNKFSMRLQASTGDYIGSMEECKSISGPPTEYYPRMATEGVVFDFIMENGKTELHNGDRVRIRTTEPATGLYCYLGAWKEPGLYYYNNSNIYKENLGWIIHKAGGSSGEKISYNDRIRIENCSYRGQFIERYKPLLYSTYYLTTKSDMSSDSIWTMIETKDTTALWRHDGESFKAEMQDAGAFSAVYAPQRRHSEVFFKGVDDFHYFYVDNEAWRHDGETFKVAQLFTTNSAVFSPQRNHSEVFITGKDGYLNYFYVENGAWRHDGESFKATKVFGAVSAVFAPLRNHSEVFVRGEDGYLHYFYFYNGAWRHDGESFKVAKVEGTMISAVFSPQRNHSEVFFRGEDDFLHYFYVVNGGWRHDGESFKAAKVGCAGVMSAVFAPQRNHSEVFFRGEDDFLHYFYVDNGGWRHDGESFKAAKVFGAISAVFSPQRNHSEVFFPGTDGYLHYFYVDNGVWRHDGESFKAAKAPGGGNISAVFSPQRNHSEVFFRGEDSYLHYFYYA